MRREPESSPRSPVKSQYDIAVVSRRPNRVQSVHQRFLGNVSEDGHVQNIVRVRIIRGIPARHTRPSFAEVVETASE